MISYIMQDIFHLQTVLQALHFHRSSLVSKAFPPPPTLFFLFHSDSLSKYLNIYSHFIISHLMAIDVQWTINGICGLQHSENVVSCTLVSLDLTSFAATEHVQQHQCFLPSWAWRPHTASCHLHAQSLSDHIDVAVHQFVQCIQGM